MSKTLYYNANIITLENEMFETAVAVENKKISEIFSDESEINFSDYDNTTDLEGKTLLPAFIDAHSHFSGYAMSFIQADLSSAESFDDIKRIILDFISGNEINDGEWLTARGYDQTRLAENMHPDKAFLDSISKDIPIIAAHTSGHAGVLNSKALSVLSINSDSGYFEENSFTKIQKRVPMPSAKKLISALDKAQKSYASYGICTVQEGMAVAEIAPLYEFLTQNNILKLDLILYLDVNNPGKLADIFKTDEYTNNIKIGGYKIFLDGSPQNFTAWLSKPYLNNRNGTPVYIDDEKVYEYVKKANDENMQIIAHTNGDMAAEQFINAVAKVTRDFGYNPLLRPVLIHSQFLQRSQMERVKKLKIIPSFFIEHVYNWGDLYLETVGRERAELISPAKTAEDFEIDFTFHQDSPVLEPDMLHTIWVAASRQTKNGVILGEYERISTLSAIKAVTKNVSMQYGEENIKGSIRVGKNADFVVLSENPLTADIESIKSIKVEKTIKDGKIIYER